MKDLTDPTNRDTVPAMLTPGEFVLNKEASEMYAPYIEQMNNHGLQVREQKNMGGPISLNDGGLAEWWNQPSYKKWQPRNARSQRAVDRYNRNEERDFDRRHPDNQSFLGALARSVRNSAIGSPSERRIAKYQEEEAEREKAYQEYLKKEKKQKAAKAEKERKSKLSDAQKRKEFKQVDYTPDEDVGQPIQTDNDGVQWVRDPQSNRLVRLDIYKSEGFQQQVADREALKRQAAAYDDKNHLSAARQAIANAAKARETKPLSYKELLEQSRARKANNGDGGKAARQLEQDYLNSIAANKNDGGMIPMNYNGIPPQHLNIGGWLSGLFSPDEERQAELQGVANRQADMEMLNSTNTQAADQYGMQAPPPMNDLPIPNSDESLLQGSSGSVENAKMAQANIPMPEQAAPPMELPVGSPERMAAIEAGEIEPNDEDFAFEEQMYNKTQELDLLRKQQAVTASDSPQAMFQQEREQNLTNDINALMVPPELGGPPPEIESGSLDFATPEEGLPEFDPGVIPGMEAPELPEGYDQIVTDTPISKADSNIRLDVAQLKKDSIDKSTEADEMAVEAEQGIRNAKSVNEIERFQRMADNAKQQKSEAEAGLAEAESGQAQITERDGVADENAQAIYDAAENRDDLRAQRTAALESIGATPNEDDMPDPLAKENTPVTKAKVTQIMQEAEMGEPLSEPEAAKAVSAGKTATPEQAAKGESAIKEAFGDLFDKKELARAGLMFAGALLTGMSPQRALAFAGQGYIKRIDGKEAIRVKNASDLAKAQAKGAANQKSILDMTNPEPYLVDGERVNTFVLQSTDANGNKVKTRVTANGQPIPPDSHQNFDTVPGTSEYNKRVHTESKTYSTAFKELQGRFGESKGKEGETQYATDLTPSKVGANTAKWAIKNGVPPEAVTQILDNAYSSARNDSKKGNKTKNIEAYLNAEYLQTKTGSAQLFEGAEPTQVNSVLNNLSESSGGKTPTQIMQFARGKWNEETEDVKESYRRRTPDGSTPFLEYLKSINSGER